VCFTDGSCFPNKKVPAACGGYAARFVLGNLADTILCGNIQNRPVYATNQRAEGKAIYEALKYAWLRADEFENLIICTDSQFWISMFTQYMPKWTAEKFASMQNSDMTAPLHALYKKITARHGVRFIHIPAHDSQGWSRAPAGSYPLFCYTHNDFVDRRATHARVHMQPGTDTVEIDGQAVDI
jgi:ribonuclease HI